MAGTERPTTPPRAPAPTTAITPEQVRRMEEARLRAKALRTQQQQNQQSSRPSTRSQNAQTPPQIAGQKRPAPTAVPSTIRDARGAPSSNNGLSASDDTSIRPARKFQKYVDYDFSKMTDTKGGFMSHEDDPTNRTLYSAGGGADDSSGKPPGMSLKEWESQQLRKKLRDRREGPYEPGLSVLNSDKKKCRECGSLEIDWQFDEALKTQVCHTCKEKMPEKYSLLTKTEAKEDYLLTDPELRDETLLPRMTKPNPHKSTWNDMMLFMRFQVEEYAFSDKKWGSAEKLDEEFERRLKETKERKEKKFKNKLNELKKRTRVDAYKKGRAGGGGEFGDQIGNVKHEHEWGRSVENPETGMSKRSCIECGMEVEELEF
jgi:DNA-repair protein complementing XP-A cells